jgi:uroporphyrinogen-III synthase
MAHRARLLLTRPLPAARRFLSALEAAHGGPVPAIISPVLEIRPVPVVLPRRPAALILTSENGAARLGELGLGGLPAWCVGPRTAAVARDQGAQVIEARPDAEGLLTALLGTRPSGPLLHLRGEHARGDLAARLRAAGLPAEEAVAYRQEALPPTPEAQAALAGPGPLVVPLFSPRSAMLLGGWNLRAPLRVVALSDAVAGAAAPLGPVRLLVAAAPDGAAMVELTLQALTCS